MPFKVVIDKAAIRRLAAELQREHDRKMELVLDRIGLTTVNVLQGFTDQRTADYKPAEPELIGRIRARIESKYGFGLHSSDPEEKRAARRRVESMIRRAISSINAKRRARAKRPKHPGGWADITRNLRDHYGYEVQRVSDGWALSITNSAQHAHLVEMRDGLFVVRGVTLPGGPVPRALREAVREIAPEWEVR